MSNWVNWEIKNFVPFYTALRIFICLNRPLYSNGKRSLDYNNFVSLKTFRFKNVTKIQLQYPQINEFIYEPWTDTKFKNRQASENVSLIERENTGTCKFGKFRNPTTAGKIQNMLSNVTNFHFSLLHILFLSHLSIFKSSECKKVNINIHEFNNFNQSRNSVAHPHFFERVTVIWKVSILNTFHFITLLFLSL